MSAPTFRRKTGYYLQYLLFRFVLALARLMPVDTASAVGGWIGQYLGPHLRRHGIARTNIRRALPELDDAQIDRVLTEMWDNLGRTFTEYDHLDSFSKAIDAGDDRIEIVGREHLNDAVARGKGVIAIGAHLANWEMSVLLHADHDIPTLLTYRPQNNPWIDRLIEQIRPVATDRMVPKGVTGARPIIEVLRAGGAVGVLIDQKNNEGLPVPFFGRDAMTLAAPIELALRQGAAIVPVRIERKRGARFRITVYPALEHPPTENRKEAPALMLRRINAMLEDWIRERPGQWYWVHQRWPRDGQASVAAE